MFGHFQQFWPVLMCFGSQEWSEWVRTAWRIHLGQFSSQTVDSWSSWDQIWCFGVGPNFGWGLASTVAANQLARSAFCQWEWQPRIWRDLLLLRVLPQASFSDENSHPSSVAAAYLTAGAFSGKNGSLWLIVADSLLIIVANRCCLLLNCCWFVAKHCKQL